MYVSTKVYRLYHNELNISLNSINNKCVEILLFSSRSREFFFSCRFYSWNMKYHGEIIYDGFTCFFFFFTFSIARELYGSKSMWRVFEPRMYVQFFIEAIIYWNYIFYYTYILYYIIMIFFIESNENDRVRTFVMAIWLFGWHCWGFFTSLEASTRNPRSATWRVFYI